MTQAQTDPVELIEQRVSERFHADESLTYEAARWAVLLAATEAERNAYLVELTYVYDEMREAEREARLSKFVADTIAEATAPLRKDSQV
jgi:hypothetical protein